MSEEVKITRKNKGKFHVSSNLLSDKDLPLTLQVFSQMQFIPLKTEFLWANDFLECVGLSPMFRETADQEVVPLYNVIVHQVMNNETEEMSIRVEVQEAPNYMELQTCKVNSVTDE